MALRQKENMRVASDREEFLDGWPRRTDQYDRDLRSDTAREEPRYGVIALETSTQKRRHLLIAGTGRSGTSLLVKLLTACGLETDLSRNSVSHFWDSDANAGLETIPVSDGDHPYVVKSPWSYQFIDQLLEDEHILLDAVLIPIRNIAESAASRIIVEMQHIHKQNPDLDALSSTLCNWGAVPGGVTYSLEPIDQARILGLSLHVLIERLMDHNIPIHFMKFPRFVRDIDYLHSCLSPILPTSIGRDAFHAIAGNIIEPGKVRVEAERRIVSELGKVAGEPADWRATLPTLAELDNLSLKRLIQVQRKEKREAAERCEGLTRERDTLARERDALTRERDALTRERDALTHALNTANRTFGELRREYEGLMTRYATIGSQLGRVLGSRSWRITAPLRGLLSGLNGGASEWR
jgi:hypothetical protein